MQKLALRLLLLLMVAVSSNVFAYAGDVTPKKGVIRVKLQPEVALQVGAAPKSLSSGGLKTGVKPLDASAKAIKAIGIRRVFPKAPKYEARMAKYGLDRWYEITFDENVSTAEAISTLKKTAGVQNVHGIVPMELKEKATFRKVTSEPKASTTAMPFNDPRLSSQWHYHNDGSNPQSKAGADINLFEAWKTTTGNSKVTVAIIDGGIDLSHEDLAANVAVNELELNGKEGVDDDGNGYIDDVYGWNFCTNSAVIYPHDHGTHVAGTVAAVNNNGKGVAGVAGGDGTPDSGVKLLSVQVFDSRSGSGDADFATAIVYAANRGATIAQCSWGWASEGYCEQSVLDAIDYFTESAHSDNMTGGLCIFAAGNEGMTGNWYPGCYDKVLSVASMCDDMTPASYSNYGEWVDVIAPGGFMSYGDAHGILSTLPGDSYGFSEGTSMATPHVSGIAALVLSKFGKQTMTNEVLRQQIVTSVNDLYTLNPNARGLYGSGYVDAAKALVMGDGTAPGAVTSFTASPAQDNVTIEWIIPASSDNNVNNHILYYSTNAFDANSDLTKVSRVVIDTKFYSSGDKATYELNGLKSLTTYYLALKAVDRWGNASALSPVVEIKTNEGPKMTVDKTSLEMQQTPSSLIATTSFNIGNEQDGLLKWNGLKKTVSSNIATYSKNNKPLLPNLVSFKGNLSGKKMVTHSVVKTDEFVQSEYPKALKYFTELSASIGENDKTLPNSAAQWFYVNPTLYPEGFNLTAVKMKSYYGQNPTVQIYSGSVLTASKLAQEIVPPYFYEDMPVQLKEQMYFAPGESFWVVFHFPVEGNTEYYPLAMATLEDNSYAAYSYMSNDLGKTWVLLSNALKGSIYEDVSESQGWAITAMSQNPDWSSMLTLNPTEGLVKKGETQEVTITSDGQPLCNGTYNFKISFNTNESEANTISIPVTFEVSGHAPKMKASKVVDFGSLLVGQEKTLTVEVYNEGYGVFGNYGFISGSDIVCSSENFEAPSYISGGFPARSSSTFEVKYKPQTGGSHSGSITFKHSDGTEFKVYLHGTATEPAKMEVEPTTIDAGELEVGGASVTKEFNIKNVGNYPLEYVFPKFSNETIEGSTSRVHKFGYTVATNLNGSTDFAYNANTELIGATDITSTFNDNVYLSKEIYLGFEFPFYGKTYERAYITSFGGVAFGTGEYAYRDPLTESSYGLQGVPYISAYGFQLTFGPNSKIEYAKQDGKFVIKYTDVLALVYRQEYTPISFRIVLSANGDVEIFYDSYDPISMNLFQAGSTLYCGLLDAESTDPMTVTSAEISDYYGYSTDPAAYIYKQFTNQSSVKFIAPKPNMVTSLVPAHGMVGPGESVKVSATLAADATMNAGETFNNIVLMSNDAENGTVLVKFNANITGSNLLPVVALESNDIDFGKVFRTSDTKVAVTVKNTGKSVMNVTAVESATKAVTYDVALPFAIEPGLSKDIIVTIPTTTSGAVSDALTITTDAGQVTANIKGEVVGVPTVELSFDAIVDSVESGTFVARDFVVENKGNENLVYSIKPNGMVKFEEAIDETSKMSYQYAISLDDSSVKYEWVDIETNGKGDQHNFSYYNMHDYVAVELPFEFPFYGKKYTKMYIYNTGFVSFTERDDQKVWPEPPAVFPGGTIYTNIIAPYWGLHSMDTTKSAGTFHYITEDEAIVSFMEYGNSMNIGVCYQVILRKDGSFKFQYKGANDEANILGIFGLAGLSNEDGSEGILLPERCIQFGNAVEFAPVLESTLVPEAKKTVKMTVDTDKMAGVYTTDIEMNTNVPGKEKIAIPVNMTITGTAKPVFPTDTIVVERVLNTMDGAREDLPNGGTSAMGAFFEAAFKVENQGTATFTISNVKNGGPSIYDDWFDEYYEVFATYYLGPETDWMGEPTGNKAWTQYYSGTPVEVGKDGQWFSIPMLNFEYAATPGTYDVPLTFYYNENDSAVVNVRMVVTPAPIAELDKEEIRVEGVPVNYKGVETVTLSNPGQYKLTYELVLDPTGKGEEVEENGGGGGIAPAMKSVAPKALSAEKMAVLKANIAEVKPFDVAQKGDTTITILDAPDKMEYNKILYYPTVAGSSTPSYGSGNNYSVYKAATYYEAPEDGFNISHVYIATTLTNQDGSSIKNADIKVEIVNGEDYEDGDVLGVGSVHIESMENAAFLVIPLDNSVYMNPGQTFYVRVTYPIGVDFPAYLTYKEEAVVSNRFMGYVEGYGWFDLASMFKESYGSLGYIMTCIETAPGEPWVKLLSPATGTVAATGDEFGGGVDFGGDGGIDIGPLSTEAPESVDIQVQVDASFAPMIKNNKAMLVIKSNDPTQPVINFPIYLSKNASPVVKGPETLVYAKENETTTVSVPVVDPDGDDFTVMFSDPAELAKMKNVTAVNPYEAAEIKMSEDGLSATVSGVTEGVNVEVEISAKYGDAGKYAFTITAIDKVKAEGQAVVSYEVEHVNQAPVANDVKKMYLAIGEITDFISYANLFTDPDGEDMTYKLTIPENKSLSKFMSNKDGFVLKGKASGTVTLTVVATDESGASAQLDIEVVVYDPASAVDVNTMNAKVEIYPNPVAETLYVTCDFSAKNTTYVLYAANGTKVYDSTESSKQGEPKAINVASLADGVYILQVTTENNSSVFHVVKK